MAKRRSTCTVTVVFDLLLRILLRLSDLGVAHTNVPQMAILEADPKTSRCRVGLSHRPNCLLPIITTLGTVP